MSKDFMVDLGDLIDDEELLANVAFTLEEALAGSTCTASNYSGTAHLLSSMLHAHIKKMRALCSGENVE